MLTVQTLLVTLENYKNATSTGPEMTVWGMISTLFAILLGIGMLGILLSPIFMPVIFVLRKIREKEQEKIAQEIDAKKLKEYEEYLKARKIKEEQEKILQENENAKNRQEQEIEAKKQNKIAHELHQENIRQELGAIVTRSQALSRELPQKVGEARNALDTAEQEYTAGAFAPFWDAVERAVTYLASFDLGVKQITDKTALYQTQIKQLDSAPPVFNWEKAIDIPDTVAITNRLREIIRNAQKNFQFAVIYEQRKTNQLLVSGFTNLAHALNDIAYRIKESTNSLSASIADLSFTMSDTFSRAIEVSEENTRATVESIQTVKEQLVDDAKVEQKREEKEQEYKEKTLVMLDNIRRHRKGT